MSVLWSLSLRAKSADETAKINEYAKELNQKYNFELYTEEYGGLKFLDWGFRYEDIDSDKVKPAKEMIKEVVAHFPDMKLTYLWTGDGSSIQWETISKNGVLVDVEPWQVWIHCEKESFGELLANIPFIKQRGFDVRCDEDKMELCWEYDHMSEEDLCNDTIVQLSKKMAQTTIYSYKSIMHGLSCKQIETFCVMKNGEGEWLVDWALERLMFCWMVHCWVLERSWSIWDIIKKPEDCFEQLLDEERMSEGANGDIYKTLSYSVEYEADNSANRGLGHWLALFKSEDKQWLMAADRMLYDCIVLVGMHHNWNTDSSDTPLFEYNEQDELRLFERVSDNWRGMNLQEQKVYINLLKFTNLDYKSILRNYLEVIKPRRKETAEDLQWLLQEIGDN